MKKHYEAPQLENVSFMTEDITIVLPDDDFSDLSGLSYTASERI